MEEERKTNLHDTAALRVLAEGRDLRTDDPSDDPDEQPPHDPLASLAGGRGRSADEAGIPAAAKKARAEEFSGRAAHALSIQFRRTAIPLLFGMAAVLVIMGTVTLVMMSGADEEALAENQLLKNGTLFAAISIALSLCLVGGGFYFHHEVKKARRHMKKANGQAPMTIE